MITSIFMLITAWALQVPMWYRITATILSVVNFVLIYIKLWAKENDIELADPLNLDEATYDSHDSEDDHDIY